MNIYNLSVYSDQSGRFSYQAFGKGWFYISFINDIDSYTNVDFSKKNSYDFPSVKVYVLRHKNEVLQMRYFCSEKGSEYLEGRLQEFFKVEDLVHEFFLACSHESNGVVHYFN